MRLPQSLDEIDYKKLVHEVLEGKRQDEEEFSRIVAKMKPADRESFLATGCDSNKIAKKWHKMTPAQREEEVEAYEGWAERLSQFME